MRSRFTKPSLSVNTARLLKGILMPWVVDFSEGAAAERRGTAAKKRFLAARIVRYGRAKRAATGRKKEVYSELGDK